VKRGEIWLANLDPHQGNEQAGIRPVLIFQNDLLEKANTILAIPLTSNLKRASLPTAVLVLKDKGHLAHDSVILCHQLRVLDKSRFSRKVGELSSKLLLRVEHCVLFTLGFSH
jgi:mRNA interferase MazF